MKKLMLLPLTLALLCGVVALKMFGFFIAAVAFVCACLILWGIAALILLPFRILAAPLFPFGRRFFIR